MLRLSVLSLVLLVATTLAQSSCPHTDSTLTRWSSVAAWNTQNAAVTITADQRILLDRSPPFKIKTLDVSGYLVVNNSNINLDVEWIRVNSGGSFIVGSESCPITQKVIFTFFGNFTTGNDMGTDPYDGTKFGSKGMAVATGATLELHGQVHTPSWTRLSATANAGATTLTLERTVNWRVGDAIVIFSTDFGPVLSNRNVTHPSLSWAVGSVPFPEQTEVRTITAVSGATVTIDAPLQYMHWGRDYEKAEVGLLTRHIVFRGDDSSVTSEFGGHLIMRHGPLHISGVEFTRFGQRAVLARYPVHFHALREVFGEGHYLKDSSVHSCFQRCLVIHETHGILVQNNVFYKTIGHCVFLEDGGERGNIIDNNLAGVVEAVAGNDTRLIIPTDTQPSVYWITNPNNTFTNNVAVGGRFGYWFTLPLQPKEVAAQFYPADGDPWVRPRWTPLGLWDNNVAHGAIDTGLEIDGFLEQNGTTVDNVAYAPKQGPFAPGWGGSYPYVEPRFYNFVAYKCREFGVWGESSMRFIGLKLFDNARGIMVNGFTVVEDSLIVGETDNIGTPLVSRGHSRSFPDRNGGNSTQITGHESYDNGGPQYSRNNTFKNFESRPTRFASALGCLINGPFMLDTRNKFLGLTFENANRVYMRTRNGDNEHGWVAMDLDGSVTGSQGPSWIVSNSSTALVDDTCQPRPEWNSFVCPVHAEGYCQVIVLNNQNVSATNIGSDGVDYTSTIVSGQRVVRAAFHEMGTTKFGTSSGGTAGSSSCPLPRCFQVMNNVKARKAYALRFLMNEHPVPTPWDLNVHFESASPGDWMIFAIPYPPSARPFNVSQNNGGVVCNQLSSINELTTAAFPYCNYFYDTATEHLYIYAVNSPSATQFTDKWGFVDYTSSTRVYRVIATGCSKTSSYSCVATKLQIPPAPVLARREDKYKADLQTCQVASLLKPASGTGVAFFYYYPASGDLHFNINHDLTATVSSVQLWKGGFGASGTLLSTKLFRTAKSPVRGIHTLTYSQRVALARGQLYVQVNTPAFPNGHLRGQIGCAGSCTPPVAIANPDPCAPTAPVWPIYNDTLVSPWYSSSWNGTGDIQPTYWSYNRTEAALCGTFGIKLGLKRGAFSVALSGSRNYWNVSGSEWKYFEFWAKVAPGFGETAFTVSFRNTSGQDIVSLATTTSHVLNYVVDEFEWTRIRIPLSQLGFRSDVQTISRLVIRITDYNTEYKELYVDELRLVGEGTEPTTTPFPASEIIAYDAEICENNGTPVTGTTAGLESEISTAQSVTVGIAMMLIAALAVLLL